MGPERLRSEAKNGLDFRVFSDVCRILLGGCIRLYRIRFGRRNFILLWAASFLDAVGTFIIPVCSFRKGGWACTIRDPEAFESQVRMAINAVFFRQNVKVPPREIRIGFRANMAVWKRYLNMSDVLQRRVIR